MGNSMGKSPHKNVLMLYNIQIKILESVCTHVELVEFLRGDAAWSLII